MIPKGKQHETLKDYIYELLKDYGKGENENSPCKGVVKLLSH